jgi:HSP20 family protein
MAETQPTSKPTVPTRGRVVDPFTALRDEMDRMLGRFEQGWPRWPTAFGRGLDTEPMWPELDVHDDANQLTVEVDLPGVEEKDVNVTLANGLLTIKGEKKSQREEKKSNYYVSERSYGSFERSIRMPDTIDENKLEARFEKGVLRIVAQKKPEAVKSEKRIEIKKG